MVLGIGSSISSPPDIGSSITLMQTLHRFCCSQYVLGCAPSVIRPQLYTIWWPTVYGLPVYCPYTYLIAWHGVGICRAKSHPWESKPIVTITVCFSFPFLFINYLSIGLTFPYCYASPSHPCFVSITCWHILLPSCSETFHRLTSSPTNERTPSRTDPHPFCFKP